MGRLSVLVLVCCCRVALFGGRGLGWVGGVGAVVFCGGGARVRVLGLRVLVAHSIAFNCVVWLLFVGFVFVVVVVFLFGFGWRFWGVAFWRCGWFF